MVCTGEAEGPACDMAFVIYFGIVVLYETIKKLSTKADTALEAGAPTTEELLTEIRDLLRKG